MTVISVLYDSVHDVPTSQPTVLEGVRAGQAVEAETPTTYFTRRLRIDHRGEEIHVVSCTCPAFKYNELPYAADVRDGDASLHAIGRCKHGDRALRADRSTEERRREQGGLDDFAVE